jgi:hypothetical protein
MQYDAAFDDNYLAWGLQARYHVTPAVRLGLLGSMAHIGYPVREGVGRPWMLPSSDETVWRVGGLVELAAVHPFRNSGVPVIDRLTLTTRVLLGVFHSSGVDFDDSAGGDDPFFGITDDPTGFAFGAGLGLEVGPYGPIRVTLQANLWRDKAYGGDLTNPEAFLGLAIDL